MERDFSDLIILLASGINQRRMYFDDHPKVTAVCQEFTVRLRDMVADDGKDEFNFGVHGGKFIRKGKYLVGPSIAGRSLIEFAQRLGCGGFTFRLPLAMVAFNLWVHGLPVLTDALHRGGPEPNWGRLITAVMPWITIAILLVVLRKFAGREHPPVDDPVLTRGRRRVAIGTLVLFVLLFMPLPLVSY